MIVAYVPISNKCFFEFCIHQRILKSFYADPKLLNGGVCFGPFFSLRVKQWFGLFLSVSLSVSPVTSALHVPSSSLASSNPSHLLHTAKACATHMHM